MDALAAALEGLEPVRALARSRWVYPFVNVGHVLGIATLFGAILVLDLRLVGLFRTIPVTMLDGVASRVAAAGLALAVLTGLPLFAVRAREYLAEPVFLWKIGLVAVATVHALAVRRTGLAERAPVVVGLASILAWTAAITAGRMIGYAGG
jgi:hypothetical protein